MFAGRLTAEHPGTLMHQLHLQLPLLLMLASHLRGSLAGVSHGEPRAHGRNNTLAALQQEGTCCKHRLHDGQIQRHSCDAQHRVLQRVQADGASISMCGTREVDNSWTQTRKQTNRQTERAVNTCTCHTQPTQHAIYNNADACTECPAGCASPLTQTILQKPRGLVGHSPHVEGGVQLRDAVLQQQEEESLVAQSSPAVERIAPVPPENLLGTGGHVGPSPHVCVHQGHTPVEKFRRLNVTHRLDEQGVGLIESIFHVGVELFVRIEHEPHGYSGRGVASRGGDTSSTSEGSAPPKRVSGVQLLRGERPLVPSAEGVRGSHEWRVVHFRDVHVHHNVIVQVHVATHIGKYVRQVDSTVYILGVEALVGQCRQGGWPRPPLKMHIHIRKTPFVHARQCVYIKVVQH